MTEYLHLLVEIDGYDACTPLGIFRSYDAAMAATDNRSIYEPDYYEVRIFEVGKLQE